MSLDLWSEIKKIWREIDILKSFDVPDISIITGWQKDIDSWTYASSTTLTIVGDVTTRFPVGTKINLTQTTVKYFYVVSATYGAPNTTLTLTGGSDYTLANAAITLPYYSYQATPQGFPQWFAYAPSLTVGNADLSGYDSARFTLNGRACYVTFLATNRSVTGSAGSIKIGLPVACKAGAVEIRISAQVYSAALGGYIDVACYVPASSAVMELYKGFNPDNWAASETGVYIFINGTYEI